MKLRKLSILVIVIFISGCGITSSYKIKEKKPEEIKITAPKPKLRVGEKLTYKAEWMGMDVGFAVLSVDEIMELNGREVYHISAKAETISFAAKLFPVEDEISTYLDTKELYPIRFDKKQKEGKKQLALTFAARSFRFRSLSFSRFDLSFSSSCFAASLAAFLSLTRLRWDRRVFRLTGAAVVIDL